MEDKTTASPGGQREIDYVRAEQLGALRRSQLPAVKANDGGKVSGRAMKPVLLAIDSHAGKDGSCFASVDTLAMETGLSRRTVLRALDGLRSLNLIVEELDRYDRRRIHRRICYPNLEDFQVPTGATGELNQCQHGTDSHRKTGATGTRIGATGTRIGATGTRISATGDTIKKERTIKKINSNGVSENCGQEKRRTLSVTFSVADLIIPERVDELWRNAVERGVLPDSDHWRETFFGLCYSIHRNREAFAEPERMLQHKLRSGPAAILAQVDDDHDRRWGRSAIRKLDFPPEMIRREPAARDPEPAPDVLDILEADELRELLARAPKWVRDYHRRQGLTKAIRPALLALMLQESR